MSGSRSGFTVTITAVDAATKQIDAVNRRIREMQAPAERLTKSFGKLADTTGITRLGNGMRTVARESLQAFENISRIGGPLGAITGVASIAGLARLSSEFATMGSQLGFTSARTGVAVGQLSALQGAATLAGSSAESLSSGMRTLKDNIFDINAGRAAPTTIAAFNSLGITLRDKVTGQLRSVTDVLPELADKIAAVKDPTMQATLATLTLGGAGEDLLPFLRRGAAGIAEYSEKARRYGAMNEAGAASANQLREQMAELGLATRGLALSIGEQLAPVLGPMLLDLAHFVRDNREMIAADVKGWAGDYATAFSSVKGAIDGATSGWVNWNKALEIGIPLLMAQAIPGVTALERVLARLALVQIPTWLVGLLGLGGGSVGAGLAVGAAAVGGYKGAVKSGTLIGNAASMGLTPSGMDDFGNPIGFKDAGGRTYSVDDAERMTTHRQMQGEHWEPATPPEKPFVPLGRKLLDLFSSQKQKNPADPKMLHDYFRSQGWTEPQVAGILGNFQGESAMDAGAIGDRGASAGLGQWRDDRRARFMAMYGHDVSKGTPLEQAQFTQWELTHTEKAAGDMLRQQTSAKAAGAVVSTKYERPQDVAMNAALRGQYAESWQKQLGNAPAASAPPVNVQGGTGNGAAAAPTATVKGSADLRIKLDGFPAGTKTTATTEGNVFNGAPKVETAMAAGAGP